MRPEDFVAGLDARPGSVRGQGQGQGQGQGDLRGQAKDLLRQSMEQHSTDRREAREHLEQSRKQRVMRIWEEARQAEQAGAPRASLADGQTQGEEA